MALYRRAVFHNLVARISEDPGRLILIGGPRQVGKTTLVRDVLQAPGCRPSIFIGVDQPQDSSAPATFVDTQTEIDSAPRDRDWLVRQWSRARVAARRSSDGYVLVFDEIQKIPNWSEVVKGLWDADRAERLNLHVVLLGSSPLLMQKGMTESLAGRFELIRLPHWSFTEMHEAFDFDLEDYIYYGGYPGGASLIRNEPRWRDYIRDSLIQPGIEMDILMMTKIEKPALLRELFHLAGAYSGQLLSYTKMVGQLQDAGNTVTLSNYLDLLGKAGMIVGLQKYAGQQVRRRASVPKLNVLNTSLMAIESGYTKQQAMDDRTFWGRMIESAVGAHLCNTGIPDCTVHYWRESPYEVDFVIASGGKLAAIEVKSGSFRARASGLDEFESRFGPCRKIKIGGGGVALSEFLSYPAGHWFE